MEIAMLMFGLVATFIAPCVTMTKGEHDMYKEAIDRKIVVHEKKDINESRSYMDRVRKHKR